MNLVPGQTSEVIWITASLLRWEGKQGIKYKAGAIQCCKEKKITAPWDEGHQFCATSFGRRLLTY